MIVRDFSNIQPTPNPNPIHVERVAVEMEKSEKAAPAGTTIHYGFVRNANLDPVALTGRW
jgi:hypothetical protein